MALQKENSTRRAHQNPIGKGVYVRNDHYQTTDASGDVVYAHPLLEGRAVYVEVCAIAVEDDASEGTVARVISGFRRAASGNVTELGTENTVTIEDSGGGPPTVTLVANTTDQTVDVTVTGEASKTLEWELEIKVIETAAA